MPEDLHARATSVATQPPGQATDARRRGAHDEVGGLSFRARLEERRRMAAARTGRRFTLEISDRDA
jgi:hypothetical protein